MSRKIFIESHGATCINWRWSWAFINRNEKIIIIGTWDKDTHRNTTMIFHETGGRTKKGRINPAYFEALEYLHLVYEGGYTLKTFPMKYTNSSINGNGPGSIKKFVPELTIKKLKKIDNKWYAYNDE